jgi:hypothetical protein
VITNPVIDSLLAVSTKAAKDAFLFAFPRTTAVLTGANLSHLWPHFLNDIPFLKQCVQVFRIRAPSGLDQSAVQFLQATYENFPYRDTAPEFPDLLECFATVEAKLWGFLNEAVPPLRFTSLRLHSLNALVQIAYRAAQQATVVRAKAIYWRFLSQAHPQAFSWACDDLWRAAQSTAQRVRFYELLTGYIGFVSTGFEPQDFGMRCLKQATRKGHFLLTVASDRGSTVQISVRPSLQLLYLKDRLSYRLKTESLHIQLYYRDQRLIYESFTLEMYGIVSEGQITARIDRTAQPKPNYERMPEYLLSVPYVAISEQLLVSGSPELQNAVLQFVRRIIIPNTKLTVEQLIQFAAQGGNDCVREYALRILTARSWDETAAVSAALTPRLLPVLRETANPTVQRLILQVALKFQLTAADAQVWMPALVTILLGAPAQKVLRQIISVLIALQNISPDFLFEEISKHLLDLIAQKVPRLPDLLNSHPRKAEWFQILAPRIDDFFANADCCGVFIDVLGVVVTNSTDDLFVLEQCKKNLSLATPGYLAAAICKYFDRSPSYRCAADRALLLSILPTLHTDRSHIISILAKSETGDAELSALLPLVTRPVAGFNRDFSAHSSPSAFAGIRNLGATCYMNSVFQLLRFTPFLDQFLSETELKPKWAPEVATRILRGFSSPRRR